MQSDKSDHSLAAAASIAIGLSAPAAAAAAPSTSSADSMESPSDQKLNGTSDPTVPYSNLKINRSIDSAPSSSLSPAGIAGLLKITLIMNGINPNLTLVRADSHVNPVPAPAPARPKPIDAFAPNGDLNRNLDQRYCILLDGIFTFLPSSISSPVASGDVNGKKIPNEKRIMGDPSAKTRAVGSMENRSIPLSGYVIRKIDEKKISLKGSKGESTSYLLEAATPEDCRRWLNVISAHVEHVDSKAGSKWIF
jgi:hypothetical protein